MATDGQARDAAPSYYLPGETTADRRADGRKRERGDRCRGNARHWFTVRGHVGARTPRCVRCGATNPKELTSDDWLYLLGIDWRGLTDAERAFWTRAYDEGLDGNTVGGEVDA